MNDMQREMKLGYMNMMVTMCVRLYIKIIDVCSDSVGRKGYGGYVHKYDEDVL